MRSKKNHHCSQPFGQLFGGRPDRLGSAASHPQRAPLATHRAPEHAPGPRGPCRRHRAASARRPRPWSRSKGNFEHLRTHGRHRVGWPRGVYTVRVGGAGRRAGAGSVCGVAGVAGVRAGPWRECGRRAQRGSRVGGWRMRGAANSLGATRAKAMPRGLMAGTALKAALWAGATREQAGAQPGATLGVAFALEAAPRARLGREARRKVASRDAPPARRVAIATPAVRGWRERQEPHPPAAQERAQPSR